MEGLYYDVNTTNLDIVLNTIEENLKFMGDDIKRPEDWDLKLDLPVQTIINKSPNEIEKLRYTIKTLEMLEYINFSNGNYSVIKNITAKGLKFLFAHKYNIHFE